MNDEETVALIAGGHTFGKTHGAATGDYVGAEPEGCPVTDRASAGRTPTAPARAPTRSPAASRSPGRHADPVGQRLLRQPVRPRVGADQEPGRREPVGRQGRRGDRPRRARPVEEAPPTMLTTDLSLRVDPEYEKISRRFHEDLDEFALAFAKAWYKLLHRDMGPVAASSAPGRRAAAVAGPGPRRRPRAGRRRRRRRPQGQDPRVRAVASTSWCRRRGHRRPASAAPTSGAAPTAPGSGSSRSEAGRSTPAEWPRCWRPSRRSSRSSTPAGGTQVSLADLIVLAGCAAVEQAAQGGRPRRDRAVHPGTHRRLPGADGRGVVRRPRTAGRRLPQLPREGEKLPAGDAAARPRQPADPLGPRADRPRRRPAGARRQRGGSRTASSPTARRR